jgi:glycogen debranching enzyme
VTIPSQIGAPALLDRARAILRANDRGGYAVPTARLYPFQWNWDSGFVAMGWASFDEARAWQEIGFLLRGQWENGMIPQIVFHAPSDDYFPGPDVWGIDCVPPTSGITQPPILAVTVRRMLSMARDAALAEARVAEIFPALLAHHRWWHAARDPDGTGLVATLHPWETGMDNSPAWDDALARVPTTTRSVIRRRDTSHIGADMRPRAEDYQRFINLVDLFRDAGWDAARMLAVSPFRVADIGTNAILLRAEEDLLVLAGRFGSPTERAEIAERIARLRVGIAGLWHAGQGIFLSRDLIAQAPVPCGTSAGFLPLFAGASTQSQRSAMVGMLQAWRRHVRWLVPSTAPDAIQFEPRRYWRGPVWAVVNWMIAEGLERSDEAALATIIRAQTCELIAQSGFTEYFDPTNGSGIGGADFSWTAAVYLMLAA